MGRAGAPLLWCARCSEACGSSRTRGGVCLPLAGSSPLSHHGSPGDPLLLGFLTCLSSLPKVAPGGFSGVRWSVEQQYPLTALFLTLRASLEGHLGSCLLPKWPPGSSRKAWVPRLQELISLAQLKSLLIDLETFPGTTAVLVEGEGLRGSKGRGGMQSGWVRSTGTS